MSCSAFAPAMAASTCPSTTTSTNSTTACPFPALRITPPPPPGRPRSSAPSSIASSRAAPSWLPSPTRASSPRLRENSSSPTASAFPALAMRCSTNTMEYPTLGHSSANTPVAAVPTPAASPPARTATVISTTRSSMPAAASTPPGAGAKLRTPAATTTCSTPTATTPGAPGKTSLAPPSEWLAAVSSRSPRRASSAGPSRKSETTSTTAP